ncbi:leucyl/phenylalanyl-tRNA--protein transferase [Ferrimonas lipolytica]|uniref:Leucyl/phenylalanyl-tRNA--protein transferase n=1 Tax=Ferrimonas lipolytica TaxID=2724191 RepID=A0A6H1UC36_9GAMM|nr:leucyl/phenylalanyl-tRNA--protein transferase [Ferrimonas lipolytica]QIZ76657.1 leucyl/phenylalanyl-tRNA--protein transferase [Ferrimonas lipolytica]
MLSAVQYLDYHNYGFPNHSYALQDPDGLLAVGGDLSVQRLMDAYRKGIFPWFNPGDPILWWSPQQRAVFIPAEIHLSRSTKRVCRKFNYHFSVNTAFSEVIAACAEPRGDDQGTWISEAMIQAYQQLHHQGLAHSIEIWQEQQLVGGIYGVAVGAAFCGESMFHRSTGASKLALYLLGQHCQTLGVELIDAQIDNPHLQSLGSKILTRSQFLTKLNELKNKNIEWNHWRQHKAAIHV